MGRKQASTLDQFKETEVQRELRTVQAFAQPSSTSSSNTSSLSSTANSQTGTQPSFTQMRELLQNVVNDVEALKESKHILESIVAEMKASKEDLWSKVNALEESEEELKSKVVVLEISKKTILEENSKVKLALEESNQKNLELEQDFEDFKKAITLESINASFDAQYNQLVDVSTLSQLESVMQTVIKSGIVNTNEAMSNEEKKSKLNKMSDALEERHLQKLRDTNLYTEEEILLIMSQSYEGYDEQDKNEDDDYENSHGSNLGQENDPMKSNFNKMIRETEKVRVSGDMDVSFASSIDTNEEKEQNVLGSDEETE